MMRQQDQSSSSLIDTAQFKKLVQIDVNPAGSDRGKGYTEDGLARTARLRQVRVLELSEEPQQDVGTDPYNSSEIAVRR